MKEEERDGFLCNNEERGERRTSSIVSRKSREKL